MDDYLQLFAFLIPFARHERPVGTAGNGRKMVTFWRKDVWTWRIKGRRQIWKLSLGKCSESDKPQVILGSPYVIEHFGTSCFGPSTAWQQNRRWNETRLSEVCAEYWDNDMTSQQLLSPRGSQDDYWLVSKLEIWIFRKLPDKRSLILEYFFINSFFAAKTADSREEAAQTLYFGKSPQLSLFLNLGTSHNNQLIPHPPQISAEFFWLPIFGAIFSSSRFIPMVMDPPLEKLPKLFVFFPVLYNRTLHWLLPKIILISILDPLDPPKHRTQTKQLDHSSIVKRSNISPRTDISTLIVPNFFRN